jgi:cyclopropane-fatty-acyl-phospholipid synthase
MTQRSIALAGAARLPLPRAARLFVGMLASLRCGRLEIIGPGRERMTFPGTLPGPDARIELLDWGVCGEVLRAGDIGFAEAYLAGWWTTPDLSAVLTLAAMNRRHIEQVVYGRWWGKLLYRLRHLLRANTRRQARRNIHAHYDLGNAFYAQWLDATMSYSSALFDGDTTQSLESAQQAKYERILRVLDVEPGASVLEIGCGWGGFAEQAARTRGCRVHGITISRRQLEFARARMERAALADQVTLDFCDYRDVSGTYDHIVSIEMIEAVGERYWPRYFDTLRARLRPGGRAVVQAITIDDTLFDNYRRGTDFIQQYIFPGGMLASEAELHRQVQRAGLRVRSAHRFGPDYAETLRRWQQRFNAAWPRLHREELDERFRRLWNFYLSYCEAGFGAGSTDVIQLELSHA